MFIIFYTMIITINITKREINIMTFKSKRTITSMITGLLLFAGYYGYVLKKLTPGSEDLKSWATATLIFIGISVVAQIVILILFHIAMSVGMAVIDQERDGEKIERLISSSAFEDEMDKLISLKADRVNFICASAGFMAVLAALALGQPVALALHILFGSFAAGSVISGGVSVYLYEKGI